MVIKKWLSLALVASQLSFFGAVVNADTSNRSAEFNLLENISTLQGEKSSNKVYGEKVKAALAAYDKIAPADGREARIIQALVDGNYATADRAQSLVDSVRSQMRATSATPKLNEKQMETIVAGSVYEGAQLSSCVYHRDLGVFLVAGGIIALPFIAHYAESGLSSFAEDWSFAGATLGIVTGVALVHFHRHCGN